MAGTFKRRRKTIIEKRCTGGKITWYLFSDCFETSRSGFFLNQELETESEKTERFLALIAKRCERIPLEYLLGETEFMGLPFLVNENVLIPRQDTECLVEEVLKKCEMCLICVRVPDALELV